ncbi:uncharacterized protein [Dysidea avara]
MMTQDLTREHDCRKSMVGGTMRHNRSGMVYEGLILDRGDRHKPSLKTLLESNVMDHASQWNLLGTYLGIYRSRLDIIGYDKRGNCVECLTEMLSWWIDNDHEASITNLNTAIKKLAVDSNGMKSAANHLIAMYTTNRFEERIDVRSFNLCRCVMPLSLIHHKGPCNDMPKSPVCFKQNDIGRDIEYIYGLLTNCRASRILIEGVAGIGKTVLSKEIAYFWAVNTKKSGFELVFFLCLRYCDLKRMESIEDLLRFLFQADYKIDCIKKNLERTKGENILLIIDGYDEISEHERTHSFVAKIIDRYVPLLLQCAMVITCRSHVSIYLHDKVQHRIQISGFLEEVQRFDYIDKALESKNAAALRRYLNSNPTIRGMCYNPLILSILCYLVKNQGTKKLADTHSKLFKDVILKIIVRDLRRSFAQLSIGPKTEFTDLSEDYYKVVTELAGLAFKILQQEKVSDMKTYFPKLADVILKNPCGFGLLNTHIDYHTEIVSAHFIHSYIQEYMAAYHISLLSKNDVTKLLNETFWKVDYYNTWIMYFGITNGETFALRHFLSGNRYELFTKYLVRDYIIADEFLNDKVKKLHLLQCFAETNNPVLICNPAKEIDLSDRMLSSVDVHAVGFFFLRSCTNFWEMLNLRNCKIGCAGLEILVEKFDIDTDITIKRTDFSHNNSNNSGDILETSGSSFSKQGKHNFYCLLFELLSRWHTRDVVVSDAVTVDGEFINEIEQVFNESNLTVISFGSNLFTNNADQKQILGAFSKAITSLHVLNCTSSLDTSWLINRHLSKLHIYGSKLNKTFVEFDGVLKHNVLNNVFIHDHSLSKEDATKIGDLLLQVKSVPPAPPYIFLIIGDGIVKGKFCTSHLRGVLSDTEILNLIVNLKMPCRPIYLEQSQTTFWRKNFGDESYFIMCSFIEITQRMNMSPKLVCELNFVLVENNTLIAHKVKCDKILRELILHKYLRAIYISNCELTDAEWRKIFLNISKKGDLLSFHLYNSQLTSDYITEFLCHLPASLKEIFIHFSYDLSLHEKLCVCAASVFVTKSQLIGVEPTCKQISLALQLEPHVTVWKLSNCQLHVDSAVRVMAILADSTVGWKELSFSGCALGDVECDILHKSLRKRKNGSTVNTLNLSYNKFTTLSVLKLVDMILLWKIKELVIDGSSQLYHWLFKNIQRQLISKEWKNKLSLSIVCDGKNICFYYKLEWNSITVPDSVTNLYLIQCKVPPNSLATDLSKLTNLNRLYFIYSMIHEQVVALVKQFMKLETNIQLSIHDKVIDDSIVSQLRVLLTKSTNLSVAMRTSSLMFMKHISQEQQSILKYLSF